MVVLDQLGRPRRSGLRTRLVDMVGQGAGRHLSTALSSAVVLAVLGCLIVLAVLALGNRRGRFAGVWLTACGVVLLSTPSWYSHYAALAAAPIALVVGAGVGRLKTVLAIRPPWGRRILTALVVLALAGYALPLRYATPGTRFPSAALRPAAMSAPGCVTADDPTTLIELDVLRRNLARGCRLVVDLSGWTYDRPPPPGTSRARDVVWQQATLDYVRGGSLTLVSRFRVSFSFRGPVRPSSDAGRQRPKPLRSASVLPSQLRP